MSSLFPPYQQMMNPQGPMPMSGGPGMPPGPGAPQPPMPGAPAPGAPGAGQEQLSPELVQAILAMQTMNPAQRGVARSRSMANQMRQDATGQLEGRQGGRLYQPPNALNLAANVMGNQRARRMDDDADLRDMNLGVQTKDAMERYFNAATKRKAQPLPYMGEEGE